MNYSADISQIIFVIFSICRLAAPSLLFQVSETLSATTLYTHNVNLDPNYSEIP